jgi:hypothetical protein
MDEALENVTAITESGRIDVSSTMERASDYNLSLVGYADDAGVLIVASAGATELENVHADVLQRLIINWEIGDWEWKAKKDHRRYTGSLGAHALHMIVRFGELACSEIYGICGRSRGEKTCCYAVVKRLTIDGFLIRRKVGRLEYFGLSPIVTDNVPITGIRACRDPVAFDAAMEVG